MESRHSQATAACSCLSPPWLPQPSAGPWLQVEPGAAWKLWLPAAALIRAVAGRHQSMQGWECGLSVGQIVTTPGGGQGACCPESFCPQQGMSPLPGGPRTGLGQDTRTHIMWVRLAEAPWALTQCSTLALGESWHFLITVGD